MNDRTTDRQTEHICSRLWQRDSATVKKSQDSDRRISTLQVGSIGIVASLIAATPYQGLPEHKLGNIVPTDIHFVYTNVYI